MGAVNQVEGGFGLYVHWPFCAAKCPYCDFNSHVRERIDQTAWRDAYLADLRHQTEQLPFRPILKSIFFGGGTPSLMAPQTAEAIIQEAHKLFPLTNDIEITLEANPTSSEGDKFRAFQSAGVNRASLGVQSLYDDALQFLGRRHNAKEALAALEAARTVFDRVSFDLIYTRPGQSLANWETELKSGLALASDHLSLYQLTFEPGTLFHQKRALGQIEPVDDDLAADMFALTQDLTAAAGLPAYEVSNHAVHQAALANTISFIGVAALGWALAPVPMGVCQYKTTNAWPQRHIKPQKPGSRRFIHQDTAYPILGKFHPSNKPKNSCLWGCG